ncbi:Hypothetical predicted protein, partial [Olea europaea subsp. europaea]
HNHFRKFMPPQTQDCLPRSIAPQLTTHRFVHTAEHTPSQITIDFTPSSLSDHHTYHLASHHHTRKQQQDSENHSNVPSLLCVCATALQCRRSNHAKEMRKM